GAQLAGDEPGENRLPDPVGELRLQAGPVPLLVLVEAGLLLLLAGLEPVDLAAELLFLGQDGQHGGEAVPVLQRVHAAGEAGEASRRRGAEPEGSVVLVEL